MRRYQQSQPLGGPGISIAISAHNEETVLRGCLESVKGWAREIVVVDSGSSDRTAAVAREYTDIVLTSSNRLMVNVNRNQAIDTATSEWILVLDPDERVSSELAKELLAVAERGADGPDGYWIPYRTYEFGRWIRTMGFYPAHQLRFFRRGKGKFPCRHLHEKLEVRGSTGYLSHHVIHRPPFGMAKAVHKQNRYSEHHAWVLHEGDKQFRLYRLLLGPPRAFLRRYLWRGGWREGVAGWIISVRAAYSSFLVNAKLWELEETPSDRKAERSAWAPSLSPPAPDVRSLAPAEADDRRM
jgi:glycosyltransferase involved in cell wall biosynthesis